MDKINVLIIEDELIIAEDIKEMLHTLGYNVTGIACDIAETNELMKEKLPDIILMDIRLRHGDDGIELAKSIRRSYKLPIVFITSHTDKATLEKAKEVQPDGYIVKPLEKEDIYSSVEIALSNFLKSQNAKTEKEDNSYFFNEYIFIKKKHQFEKVKIQDIQWIKSDGNYLEVYCDGERKFLIRSTFSELFQNIQIKSFIQVHKSYAVNFDKIDAINVIEIRIGKNKIPISKTYRQDIQKRINIVY